MASIMFTDVEDESIMATIFKDAFPDSWRDNAEFAHYLAELSSFGVEKLNREPDRLAEERAQILEQTQDLAFHNYKTFIQTANCCKEIFQDFQIIEKHLTSVLSDLPNLNQSCDVFMKKAQDINSSRKMNNVTLQRHSQLLEILEIPQLMDTCVRNGYYEEALELAAHVKRLEKKHATIPIIAARDAWFQTVLHGIPTDDSYYHISKTIEASRVHLFDIITQYRAIFSDDDPMLTPMKDDKPNESALFHGWVVQKVSQFLHSLEADLERGVGGRLDSLLAQCMYFGLSFSRVGADFRGLLAPIFQSAALVGFKKSIDDAGARLDEMLQSYTLLGTPSVAPTSLYGMTASQAGNSLQPPSVLLEFHPLAVYCNNVLSAFNDLRTCAPLALACDVSCELEQSLRCATECIVAYHRVDETTFNAQELEKFGQLCRAFAQELVPYLNKCLQALFPPAQLSLVLGIPASDLYKLKNVGMIDVAGVVAPLQHLLPAAPKIELVLTLVKSESQTLAEMPPPTADTTSQPSDQVPSEDLFPSVADPDEGDGPPRSDPQVPDTEDPEHEEPFQMDMEHLVAKTDDDDSSENMIKKMKIESDDNLQL